MIIINDKDNNDDNNNKRNSNNDKNNKNEISHKLTNRCKYYVISLTI